MKDRRKQLSILEKKQKITSREYCELCSIAKDTANRDLNDLLNKEVIEKRGKGPQIFYVLRTIVRYRPMEERKNDYSNEFEVINRLQKI